MAFDSTTRGKLQRLVTACRTLLTDEFDEQLQSIYGVYAEDGRVLELDKLPNLDDDERITGALLRERIDHLQSGLIDSKTPLKEAVQRVLREQAFTVLNRFAALRMAEERELVLQCVGDGLNSKGFQVFENVASPDLGSQYARYCIFLSCLFDELSLDLGVLFDRYSPFGLLFPREPKPKEFLQLLNDPELKSLWREDETIGWIYQYFNDPAERKLMREAAAPRDSRELAVRNQFFTPRYVVQFLIDNTLGRLWYEMTKGRTELARCCRYLLRRPNEVFLGNPNVISSLDAAASWVREVILAADFSRLPEDPTIGALSDFGLAIDGYAEMERRGGSLDDFIATFYNPQLDAAEKTGQPWKGDAFELWCALFAYQRGVLRHGQFSDTERASGDETLRDLWPALRHALQNPPADLSQEEMLRQPQFIPHRPVKDPREIRLLDPACGSMHFGLYAFDLFETIYAEAHLACAEVGTEALRDGSGRGVLDSVSADAAAFVREVPRLIVGCNIHGIDIDPRAVQIAGLSLWLRAQRAWHQAGVKPADRPRISRSNLVCAEPMPGEKHLLSEFVEQQFPASERPAFGFLLEKIFDHMTLAGEAGSLLRIEEEIRAAIGEAKRVWRKGPRHEQGTLFPEVTATPEQGAMRLDLSGITDEQFWARAEQRIYDALKAYAEQAENGGGFQRRLFVDDAAQGFAFIDLCRRRYDVAVMNPPFGEFPPSVVDYVCAKIPGGRNDIYSAMILRLADYLMQHGGRLGAITSRAFVVGRDLRDYRKALIRDDNLHLSVFLDLGAGVLDGAMVETAAYIVANERQERLLYRDLRSLKESERREHINDDSWKVIPLAVFRETTDNQLLFGLDTTFLEALQGQERFIPNFAEVTQGLTTEDDVRFVRLRWEVPVDEFDKTWFIFAKGGEYSWFTSDLHLAIKRSKDGAELAAFVETKSGNVARTRQSSKFYGVPGATYSRRSQKGFSCRRLRSDTCFSDKSGVIFPIGPDAEKWRRVLPLLLASESYLRLVDAQSKFGSFEVGSIKLLPRPDSKLLSLHDVATGIYRQIDALEQHIEISSFFVAPRVGRDAFTETWQTVITKVSDALRSHELALRREISEFQNDKAVAQDEEYCSLSASVNYAVGCAFGRWDIRYATGERPTPELPAPFAPLPICPPGMLQGDDDLPLSPEAGRRIRADGRYPFDVAWDGILVDDPDHALDLEARVRAGLTVLWGDRSDALEHEACSLLGVPTLRDWFRRPAGFFADHLKRYSKSRRQAPIYWPLSTTGGSYTLWLYYDRLNVQTLYTCVTDFIKPKLHTVTADADHLQAKTQTGGTAKERAELQELRDFQAELQDLHDELLRVAQLPWKPNLNDGVLITASPLWKLFRLPKWQKDLKACWEELAAGDYDWAHLALTIWPDRVGAACKTDRSLAIAHGLEDLCEVEAPKPKAKRAKKPGKEKPAETLDFQ